MHEAAQWDWVRRELLPSAPAEHYRVTRLEALDLPPALLETPRTDTINRAVDAPRQATSPYEPDLDAPKPTPPSGLWAIRYDTGPG